MRTFIMKEIEKLEIASNEKELHAFNPFEECLSGRSYLSEAIVRGDIQNTRIMLERLGFIDKEDSRLQHCFYLALQKGNVDIIQMLIEKNLNVHKAFAHVPYYKLEEGKENKNIVVAKLLLDAGADMNVTTLNRTPLENAFFYKDLEYARFLVSVCEKNRFELVKAA